MTTTTSRPASGPTHRVVSMRENTVGNLSVTLVPEIVEATSLTEAKLFAGNLADRHADRIDAFAVFRASQDIYRDTPCYVAYAYSGIRVA